MLRGRKLSVTYASQVSAEGGSWRLWLRLHPADPAPGTLADVLPPRSGWATQRPPADDDAQPDQEPAAARVVRGLYLPLLHVWSDRENAHSAAAQIAALEAKLSTMKNSPLAAASATAPLRAAGETASAQGSRQGSADVDADADLDNEMDTPASGSGSGNGTPALLTEEDIEQEMARLRRDLEADLEQARIAAGLPPSERAGSEVGMSGLESTLPTRDEVMQDKGKGRADEGNVGAQVGAQEPVEDSRPVPSQANAEGDALVPAHAPASRSVPTPPALPSPSKPAADMPSKPIAPVTITSTARPRGTLPPPPPGLPRKPPASIHEAAFSRR